MARPPARPDAWTSNRIAWGLGAAAGLLVLLTLGDPGITVDEPLDVRPGQAYVQALWSRGWHFFDRAVVDRVFADNAEHPPLGRWLLGIASTLGEPFLGGLDPYSVHAGRLAPALCFAALVGLITREMGRRYGRAAGVVAGLAPVLMPRVFAHAHLAALDTFLSLFWVWALLAAARALEARRTVVAMAGAGVVWGLALLTKIHGWLLAPVVITWTVLRLRSLRSVVALAAWGIAGVALFFTGWPWLWYDTSERLWRYFGTAGAGRLVLHVQYFGQVYADRDVPWHYPWFYFAATVPIGLHALGGLGLAASWRRRRDDPFPLLSAAAIGLFLVLFSTNVPVYDGERLFLVAFPLWALLIGLGFRAAWTWAGPKAWRRWGLVGLLLAQGYGVVALHPFGLSYYNALVGGLPGAERLGLELTYWGDAVDAVLLDELAGQARPGQLAAMAPTLHHLQAPAAMTPELLQRKITLADESALAKADWVVLYRRSAYWNKDVRALARTRPTALRTRQGIWLSGLWPGPTAPRP
ncbi:MAG: glycosyltransferase family 39 protein [Isosphaeraceae bacterium]|nr:glycosyltransferase family 39 protein [Isosphaeraceae bacterium]